MYNSIKNQLASMFMDKIMMILMIQMRNSSKNKLLKVLKVIILVGSYRAMKIIWGEFFNF